MRRIQRVMKMGVLAMLGATLAGCIVLPYGARGRHGHGGYHHSAPAEAQPVMPHAHRPAQGR